MQANPIRQFGSRAELSPKQRRRIGLGNLA
jgi:hypothetical protein